MPLIGKLSDFQRGSILGQLIEVFLLGIHTCLLVVTLWRPLKKGRPLNLTGWFVVAVYWLTACHSVIGFLSLHRIIFINDGNPSKFTRADHALQGTQAGCTMIAAQLADSLFIRRLYVIWSRNIRIVLLPAFLFICGAISATVLFITAYILGNDPQDTAVGTPALLFLQASAIANTCYVTVLVAGRIWWVGRTVDELQSPRQIQKSRYRGVITALVQSGSMYTIANILSLVATAKNDTFMLIIVGDMTASVVGLSATLLVLQLNMFQDETKGQKVQSLPLTTGATIQFARHRSTCPSDDSEAEVASPPPPRRRRRASIAAYYILPQYDDSDRDTSCFPRSSPSPPQHSPPRTVRLKNLWKEELVKFPKATVGNDPKA